MGPTQHPARRLSDQVAMSCPALEAHLSRVRLRSDGDNFNFTMICASTLWPGHDQNVAAAKEDGGRLCLARA